MHPAHRQHARTAAFPSEAVMWAVLAAPAGCPPPAPAPPGISPPPGIPHRPGIAPAPSAVR